MSNHFGNNANNDNKKEDELVIENKNSEVINKKVDKKDDIDQYFKEVQEKNEFEIAEEHQKPSPEVEANWLSKLTFWWIGGLMSTGYSKVLQVSDLYQLHGQNQANDNSERFHKNWKNELLKEGNSKKKPSLVYALHKTYGLRFYLAGILKLIYDSTQLISPLFVKWIISFMEEPDAPFYMGYVYVGSLFILQIFGTIILHQYFHIVTTQGMRIRTGLSAAIYRKSLRLTSYARQQLNTGEVINYMSIDANKIQMLVTYLHLTWSGVFQIVVCLAMLFNLIGVSTIAGCIIMIVVIPINGFVARIHQKLRKQILAFTGDRIKILNEIIQGIRILKFYAWEDSFLQKVMKIRDNEIFKTLQTTLLGVFTSMLMTMAPLFVSIATFSLYGGLGNLLEANIIFPALSYFNLLRFPTAFFPQIIAMVVETRVSLGRIENYLIMEELEEKESGSEWENPVVIQDATFSWTNEEKTETPKPKEENIKKSKGGNSENYAQLDEDNQENEDEVTIELNDEKSPNQEGELTFIEDKGEDKAEKKEEEKPQSFRLKNVNLTVNRGDLVVVIGPVGCGKSSLLSALIGEMKQASGKLNLSGSVAYVPQQAWIRNATVRDNITFGLPFNHEKYVSTVENCALSHDLEILSAGDMTEIGEKGITLSGGQKQRVNLARAVYSDADIYLFDDVLSALDQHVGRFVFEKCITGILKNKTRILVTHQWQYLKDADYIVVMKDGEIISQGRHEELLQNTEFSRMITQYIKTDNGEEEEETEEKEEEQVEKKKTKAIASGKLVQNEERAEGTVKLGVYLSYFKYAGGYAVSLFILLMFTLAQTSQIMTNWFLARWTQVAIDAKIPDDGRDDPHDGIGYDLMFYIGLYVGLGVASSLLVVFQDIAFGLAGLRAAKKLHNNALSRVISAPTSFFDTNPVGRILNRFSKDTESIDTSLIGTLRSFIGCLFQVTGTIVIITTVTPLFLLPIIPLFFIYWRVQNYYRSTSRELKRLDSISRSPLFAHFSETLTGLSTIRAYKKQSEFTLDNEKQLDRLNRACYAQLASQRWLAVRLELISALVVLASSIFSLLGKGGVASSMAGLSLSYALSVTGTMNWTVRAATEAEAIMNSVERVLHYCEEIPTEAAKVIPDNRPPEDWPQEGNIELNDVKLRYREDLDFVLKGLTLEINGTEKVGVVGRTGSGKSTLMSALFRIVELAEGNIVIDGIDISKIGLYDLRSKLAIIPQDPVMFSGTVRFNLDPFDMYSDQQIWQALERSHMKEAISKLSGQLEAKVVEYGENFSVGQRQLLCLARAILRKTKVLIMDEATASVDMETDSLIQETVRSEFSDRTVLTVAHRLNTIIDADRILVLKDGQLAEFDTPKNLLSKETSIFSSLVEETGRANASYLKSIALGETTFH
ncbi:hypothetical protein ABK040_013150 [Willaertia magna]